LALFGRVKWWFVRLSGPIRAHDVLGLPAFEDFRRSILRRQNLQNGASL